MQRGAHPWVATGKHLCGAATDFTLRCCASSLQSSARSCQPSHATASPQPVPTQVAGDTQTASQQPTGAQSAKQHSAAGSALGVQSLTASQQPDSVQAAAIDKQHNSPQPAASQTAQQPSIADTDCSVQTATHTQQQGRLHQAAVTSPMDDSAKQWCADNGNETAVSCQARQQQCAGDDQGTASRSDATVQAGTEQGIQGLAVATCCHHRCSWQHYVGKPLFRQLGFSPDEFEVISWMTGERCTFSLQT